MKILEAKSQVTEEKSYPGLFTCKMVHQIKETTASFKYDGPRFNDNGNQMWQEILAFFKWSYAKTRGETQVRLFVHPTLGWRAWAFPQEASVGLSTHELPDNEETRTQRAQFGDDWILYGTVHHHCSSGAFQSGTDTNNEKDQEGIHITIGDMDKDVHSIHCRFYYRGCKFQPNLSAFWDIGQEARIKATELADYFGIKIDLDSIAETQMRQTVPIDTPFPEVWQTNLIEKKYNVTPTRGGGFDDGRLPHIYRGDDNDVGYQGFPSKAIKIIRKYFRQWYKEEIKEAKGITQEIRDAVDDDVEEALQSLQQDAEASVILFAMNKHNCKIEDLLKRLREIQILEMRDSAKVEPEEVEASDPPKKVHEMTEAEFAEYMQNGGKLPGEAGWGENRWD